MSSSFNIILFGETGVGKSSVINLIAGKEVAKVSSDLNSCTLTAKSYDFLVNNRTYHIWDTVGLNEPELGSDEYLPAIEHAFNLIHHLNCQGGVDLLLFCMRNTRLTATTQSNYRLFHEVICDSRVPIALVITHLEWEPNMEMWWEKNVQTLAKFGISCAGHACVTGLPHHKKYSESRSNIFKLLEGCDSDGRFNMPPKSWFTGFLRLFGRFAPLKAVRKRREVLKVLTKRCKLDKKTAEELANILEEGRSV